MNCKSLRVGGLSILAIALVALKAEAAKVNPFEGAKSVSSKVRREGDVLIRTLSIVADPKSVHQQFFASEDLSLCRARIPQALCLVDPMEGQGDDFDRRPCEAGGEKYASAFEGHFDRSVPVIQKMYCHLEKIWIEKSFVGTAYAGLVEDASGQVLGGGIGIRREVLESKLGFDDWLSWKEETTFGGSADSRAQRLGIINYQSNRPTPEFFLDYVLNHEFAHLFDFTNRLNRTTECRYREKAPGEWERVGTCEPLPGSWGELSWKNIAEPLPGNDFPDRAKICFYFCDGKNLATAQAPMIFALKFAHEQGLQLGLSANGVGFDVTSHFLGPKLDTKRQFVDRLIQTGLLYPGQ